MTTVKFYRCKHCGNIIIKIEDHKVPVMCCGEEMEELIPNTVDAATEKHVPVVSIHDYEVTVTVGEVAHPMEEAHHIAWIYVKTEHGGMYQYLEVGKEPKAIFYTKEKVEAVYEYCNLHGLWKKEI